MVDKAPVKVCKPEEGLDVLNQLRSRPVRDCRELAGAHLDAIGAKPEAEIFDFRPVELALLRISEEPSALETLKNHPDVTVVLFLVLGKDQNVIDVHDTHDVEEVTEGVLDESLESSWSISKTIRDNEMFKKPEWCAKHSCPLVALLNPEVAVSRFEVNDCESLASLDTIEKIMDKGNWVSVFLCDGIQTMVIHTEAQFTRLLAN